MLPLEIATQYLDLVTQKIVKALLDRDISAKEPEMLNALTKPFTRLIIQLDKDALESLASGNKTDDEFHLLKYNCKKSNHFNVSLNHSLSNQYEKCK